MSFTSGDSPLTMTYHGHRITLFSRPWDDDVRRHPCLHMYPLEEFNTSDWEHWQHTSLDHIFKSVQQEEWPGVHAGLFSMACEILTQHEYGDAADLCLAEFKDMVRPKLKKEDNTNGFGGVHPLHITTNCAPVCMWLQTNEVSNHIHLCFLVDGVVTLVNI